MITDKTIYEPNMVGLVLKWDFADCSWVVPQK